MMFMNEYDIDCAAHRVGHLPNLGAAVTTIANLRDWANQHSDGWAYWPKPVRAAEKLMVLIESADRFDPEDVTAEAYAAAVRPIKAFRTRQGADFVIADPVRV